MDGGLIKNLLGQGRPEAWPSKRTWYTWVASEKLIEEHDVRAKFDFALDVRTQGWAEEIIEIADNAGVLVEVERSDGSVFSTKEITKESVSMAANQCKVRMWAVEKWMPRKFGKLVSDKDDGNDRRTNLKVVEMYPDTTPEQVAGEGASDG